jgi:hypothetical protein
MDPGWANMRNGLSRLPSRRSRWNWWRVWGVGVAVAISVAVWCLFAILTLKL